MLLYYDGCYGLEKIEKEKKRGRPAKDQKTEYQVYIDLTYKNETRLQRGKNGCEYVITGRIVPSCSDSFTVFVDKDGQYIQCYNDMHKLREIPKEIWDMIRI
jgi:hypothetical protein